MYSQNSNNCALDWDESWHTQCHGYYIIFNTSVIPFDSSINGQISCVLGSEGFTRCYLSNHRNLRSSYLFLNLDFSVESRKSAQVFNVPRKFEKLLITDKVITDFANSLYTSI